MKNYISVLLALLIALSMLPVQVMATDETTTALQMKQAIVLI